MVRVGEMGEWIPGRPGKIGEPQDICSFCLKGGEECGRGVSRATLTLHIIDLDRDTTTSGPVSENGGEDVELRCCRKY